MNVKEFKESKDAVKLAELYSNTKLFHFSRVWQGKSFQLVLTATPTGVRLFYLDTIFFKAVETWHETKVNENEEIPDTIRAAFVEDAKAVARQFYAKIDYLSSPDDNGTESGRSK